MSPLDEKRYTSDADPAVPASAPAAAPAVATPSEAELVARFRDRIRLFAARRLGDAAAAEDVAQETLRRVVIAMRAGRIDRLESLPGFVFQTASHVCLHRRRSAGREARALARLRDESVDEPDGPDALAALVGDERRAAVRAALDRLSPGDRELLLLLFYERLETAEVARRCGTTPAALRVRKHRALQRLGELLGGRP
jgi:RNA polymerase sigma-70 factor (ECF subfamily)